MMLQPRKYNSQVKSLRKIVDRYRKKNLDLQHQLKSLRLNHKKELDNLAESNLEQVNEDVHKRSDPVSKSGVTIDPFKLLPPELHGLILQHLIGSDIIQSSEVSKNWFKHSNSPDHRRKIKINVDYSKPKTIMQKAKLETEKVMKVKRQHKNISIVFDSDSEIFALRALKMLGDEVESLELEEKLNGDRPWPSLDTLKKLKLCNLTEDIAWTLFNSDMKLDVLILGPEFSISLFDFVKGNPIPFFDQKHLKVLYLESLSQLLLFQFIGLGAVTFKLRKLSIASRSDVTCFMYVSFAEVRNVFFSLLENQKDSLKELIFLHVARYDDLVQISKRCPDLKSLRIRCRGYKNDAVGVLPDLQRNLNLNALRVCKWLPIADFGRMIHAFPNIEILRIDNLTKDHIALAALTEVLPNLRLVKYSTMDTDVLEFYETMKMERSGVNESIVFTQFNDADKSMYGDDF